MSLRQNVPVTEFSGEPDEIGTFWMHLTHTNYTAFSYSKFYRGKYGAGIYGDDGGVHLYYCLVARVLVYI